MTAPTIGASVFLHAPGLKLQEVNAQLRALDASAPDYADRKRELSGRRIALEQEIIREYLKHPERLSRGQRVRDQIITPLDEEYHFPVGN